MRQAQRQGTAWWEVELFGAEAERASWLALARREGHRLVETVDGEGRSVTAAWICEPRQVEQLAHLMQRAGVGGSFTPIQ
jgi:hypothetical protein